MCIPRRLEESGRDNVCIKHRSWIPVCFTGSGSSLVSFSATCHGDIARKPHYKLRKCLFVGDVTRNWSKSSLYLCFMDLPTMLAPKGSAEVSVEDPCMDPFPCPRELITEDREKMFYNG